MILTKILKYIILILKVKFSKIEFQNDQISSVSCEYFNLFTNRFKNLI